MAHIYEQLTSLLDGEPDLKRELVQYVTTSCYSTGYVHTMLPS